MGNSLCNTFLKVKHETWILQGTCSFFPHGLLARFFFLAAFAVRDFYFNFPPPPSRNNGLKSFNLMLHITLSSRDLRLLTLNVTRKRVESTITTVTIVSSLTGQNLAGFGSCNYF